MHLRNFFQSLVVCSGVFIYCVDNAWVMGKRKMRSTGGRLCLSISGSLFGDVFRKCMCRSQFSNAGDYFNTSSCFIIFSVHPFFVIYLGQGFNSERLSELQWFEHQMKLIAYKKRDYPYITQSKDLNYPISGSDLNKLQRLRNFGGNSTQQLIGKEQVELENISRRRYPDKWGKLTDKDVNRFYKQDEVNRYIRTITNGDDGEIHPYTYTEHGDSYFLSKNMYESLVAKCRCGRQRTEGHTIKCLQKVQSKYLKDGGQANNGCEDTSTKLIPSSSSTSSMASGDDVSSKRIHYGDSARDRDTDIKANDSFGSLNDKSRRIRGGSSIRLPETSNGMIGWPKSRFSEWEQSAKYVSPIVTMPGYKVTEYPYNVIIIG